MNSALRAGLLNITVDLQLDPTESRVLGALIEKDITTPDYYPLSLNALVNACNQKNNRDPVMSLDENAVREALDSLHAKGLAGPMSGADSRVTKYEHRLQEAFNFRRDETAVLCVLLLRGPQTPGELRGRTERMHHFNDLDEVQSTLQRLIQRDPPLIAMLTRQPGTKESRYVHLFSGDVESWQAPAAPTPPITSHGERVAQLEAAVADLHQEIAELKREFAKFRQQFE